MPRDYPRPHLLIAPEALAAELGRPGLRVVDVRWRPDGTGRALWTAGRIPGSIHLDWTRWLAFGSGGEANGIGRFRLAPAERVRTALTSAGIGPDDTIVLYDEAAALFAARAWWAFRAWGIASPVRILDGGFPAWVAAGHAVEEGEAAGDDVAAPDSSGATAGLAPLPAWPVAHADLDAVRAALDDPTVAIVDARAPTEFRGHGGNGERLGRIPGAVNVPAGAIARPGSSRFRGPDELAALVARMGLAAGRRAICYDATGIGAAKLAFAAALLGHDDVAVYDGGWLEWSSRLDLPVER